MKKDDFFFQYQYDHELSARLKNRQERMLHSWNKVLIFSVAAFVIPLFFSKIDLSAIIFLIAFVVFLLCATVYIFTQTMIRPCCKKCGKRMLKKIHIYRMRRRRKTLFSLPRLPYLFRCTHQLGLKTYLLKSFLILVHKFS